MEFFAAGFLVLTGIFLLICIMYLFFSLLLYISAALVNIHDRSFGKALLSTLLATLISFASGLLVGFIPFIGPIISFIASFIIPVVVTQFVFKTDFIKALLAELIRFAFVMVLFGIFILAVIGIVGLEALQSYLMEFSGAF